MSKFAIGQLVYNSSSRFANPIVYTVDGITDEGEYVLSHSTVRGRMVVAPTPESWLSAYEGSHLQFAIEGETLLAEARKKIEIYEAALQAIVGGTPADMPDREIEEVFPSVYHARYQRYRYGQTARAALRRTGVLK